MAFPRRLTRTSRKGEGIKFYGNKDGKAVISPCRIKPAAERRTRNSTSGFAPGACWNTGTPVP